MEATSQVSSIFATSKEVVNIKEKDFKSKQDEASNSNISHKHLDFVKLSNNDLVRKMKVRELDFLSSTKVGSSSNEGRDKNYKFGCNTVMTTLIPGPKNNIKEKTSESKRTFSYNFCKREFSTLQALGGHQNAHKPERELKKHLSQRIYDGVLGNPNFPYYTYPSAISIPPYYRPLGVRMDSMIQKPSYPRTPYSFGYGHGAMLWQQMLNTSNVGLRNIEGTSGATSRIQDGGGSGINNNNNVRSTINFGGSSTNLATRSRIIMDKKIPAPNKDEIHYSKIEISSDSDSSGLDLSLKL